MTRERYESLALSALKDLAKARKIKGTSLMKKNEIIDAMMALDAKEEAAKAAEAEVRKHRPRLIRDDEGPVRV